MTSKTQTAGIAVTTGIVSGMLSCGRVRVSSSSG